MFAIAAIGFNVLSIVAWFGVSGARIECEDGKICAVGGPQLAIASNFLMLPAVAIYLVSFWRRREIIPSIDIANLNHYNSIVENKSSLTPDDTVFVKHHS